MRGHWEGWKKKKKGFENGGGELKGGKEKRGNGH